MVQGYYTLQEAASHLNIAVDELKRGGIEPLDARGNDRLDT